MIKIFGKRGRGDEWVGGNSNIVIKLGGVGGGPSTINLPSLLVPTPYTKGGGVAGPPTISKLFPP